MTKITCALALGLLLSGCDFGYSHQGNEVVGQPKSVETTTPLICPAQHILDLSLGVMRHGVGSMSTEDVLINIPDDASASRLEAVVREGKLISAQTNEARVRWCNEEKELVSFKVIDDEAKEPSPAQ